MKISYTKYGDYYLPDLTVPNKKYNIGRFGMMHLKYIKQHRPRVLHKHENYRQTDGLYSRD